jgi:hypothetical protein
VQDMRYVPKILPSESIFHGGENDEKWKKLEGGGN